MSTLPIDKSTIVAIASPLEGKKEYTRCTVIVEHEGTTMIAHRWTADEVIGAPIDLDVAVTKGLATKLNSPVPARACVAWVLRPNMEHAGEYGRKHLRLRCRSQIEVVADEKRGDYRMMLVPEPTSKMVRFDFAAKVAAHAVNLMEHEHDPQAVKVLFDRAIMLCPDKERKAEYQALRDQIA